MDQAPLLNEKDVVYLTASSGAGPYINYRTFRVSDFVEVMKSQVGIPSSWLQGMPCELLKTGASDWKKGKVRIRVEFEFIPDEPELPVGEASELDALRSKLDL